MEVSELGIIEIDAPPPPLDLPPAEIEALAETLLPYQAECAPLSYRQEQAHWGEQSRQGLLLPLERQALAPMALALEGDNVQALHQYIGPGQWQDEAWLQHHWHVVTETLGAKDGVGLVESAECPQQGAHAVGVARPWCGRLGTVAHGQSGVVAADASIEHGKRGWSQLAEFV